MRIPISVASTWIVIIEGEKEMNLVISSFDLDDREAREQFNSIQFFYLISPQIGRKWGVKENLYLL